MKVELLVDNDVLIKGSCYSLIGHVKPPSRDLGAVGILGAARFVVGNYLERRGRIRDREKARASFDRYLAAVSQLEPAPSELNLASVIEEKALELGLDLDGGESQLCAMAVHRGWPLVLTGDKRAIKAIEVVAEAVDEVSGLRGRVACLEQAIAGITDQIGADAARMAICGEPDVDRAISICFECSRPDSRSDFKPVGLASYIAHLRAEAPTVLYPSDSL